MGVGCPPLGVAPRPGERHPALKHRRRFRQRAAGAWGGFQAGLRKSSAGRGPAQETPDEGFLRKTVRRTIFLFSCVCRRRLRPWDAVPHPATFEKVDETFTRLRRGRALSVRSGAAFRRRPRARRDSPGTGLIDTPSYSNTDSSSPGTQRGSPGRRPAPPADTGSCRTSPGWRGSSPRAGCPLPPGP